MGDVFDAMNRAQGGSGDEGKRPKRAESPLSPEQPDNPSGAADDQPSGLPFEGMQVESINDEDARSGGQDTQIDFRKPPPPTATAVEPHQQAEPAGTDTEPIPEADEVEQPAAREAVHGDGFAEDEDDDRAKLNGYANEVVVHHDRASVITEQYRAIRTQILARGRNRKLQTHVITSSAPGEGKSVTTINLGIIFSELRNQKTLLVECDLRRPTFGKLLDRDEHDGMLQLLRGEVKNIDDAIHRTVYNNLDVIPAGGRDSLHSTELLSSPKMGQIIDRLRDRYDHIFIDSPPVVSVTDAAILGAMCDETLMVVRLNKTPTDIVDRAKRLLRANNCEVTGVILTHLKIHMPRYLYRYSYGYGYGYGYGSKYS